MCHITSFFIVDGHGALFILKGAQNLFFCIKKGALCNFIFRLQQLGPNIPDLKGWGALFCLVTSLKGGHDILLKRVLLKGAQILLLGGANLIISNIDVLGHFLHLHV